MTTIKHDKVNSTKKTENWEYIMVLLIIPIILLLFPIFSLTPMSIFSIDDMNEPIFLKEYYSVGSYPVAWILTIGLVVILLFSLLIPINKYFNMFPQFKEAFENREELKTFTNLIFTISILIIQNIVRTILTREPLYIRGENVTAIIEYNLLGGVETILTPTVGFLLFYAAISSSLAIQLTFADKIASEKDRKDVLWIIDRLSQFGSLFILIDTILQFAPEILDTIL
ncbi:MAG: hypothetical protein ACTSW1_03185 [Candidatus Hodarchaeales archaeon]